MNGDDLIAMGYQPGAHFKKVLSILNEREHSNDEIATLLAQHEPQHVQLQETAPCIYNITADNDDEQANIDAVKRTMDVVLQTPVVTEAVIMPDACPAGAVGVIPVGGVVATASRNSARHAFSRYLLFPDDDHCGQGGAASITRRRTQSHALRSGRTWAWSTDQAA